MEPDTGAGPYPGYWYGPYPGRAAREGAAGGVKGRVPARVGAWGTGCRRVAVTMLTRRAGLGMRPVSFESVAILVALTAPHAWPASRPSRTLTGQSRACPRCTGPQRRGDVCVCVCVCGRVQSVCGRARACACLHPHHPRVRRRHQRLPRRPWRLLTSVLLTSVLLTSILLTSFSLTSLPAAKSARRTGLGRALPGGD